MSKSNNDKLPTADEINELIDPSVRRYGDEVIKDLTPAELDNLRQDLREVLAPVLKLWIEVDTNAAALIDKIKNDEDDIKDLSPYIQKAIKKIKRDPAYQNLTFEDVMSASDPQNKFAYILDLARRLQEEDRKIKQYPLQPRYDLTRYSVNNNNLINYLQDSEVIGTGAFDLPALKGDITAYTSCEFREDSGIYQSIKSLTEYERSILDTIGSLKKYANDNNMPCLIDGYIVGSKMPGGGTKILDAKAQEINAIIEKFRHFWIETDITSEMRARGADIAEGDEVILRDYCLSAKEMQYRTRTGQVRSAFLLKDLPLPSQYAEMTNEVISIPAKCYNISKVKLSQSTGKPMITNELIKMNENRQACASYILRRICIMQNDWKKAKDAYRKHEKKRREQEGKGLMPDEYKPISEFCKQRHVIAMDTLLSKIYPGKEISRKNASDINQFVRLLLDYEQAIEFISGYEMQSNGKAAAKGQKITGIKIILLDE